MSTDRDYQLMPEVNDADFAPRAIPAYDPQAICHKCGQTPVGTTFCNITTPMHWYGVWGPTSDHWPKWVYVEGGHLHRTCGRCNHAWIELALDARMLTAAEAKQLNDEWRARAEQLAAEREESDLRRYGSKKDDPECGASVAAARKWWRRR